MDLKSDIISLKGVVGLIELEEMFVIKDMKSRGMYIKDIARILDRDPKTISKYVKSDKLPEYKKRPQRASKLDPYKEYILERMNDGCLNSAVILEEIQAMGYTGKSTILQDFMRPRREKSMAKASTRYETPPGKQAQVDWGEFTVEDEHGKLRRLHGFLMVMGYSREMYLEFTEDEKIDTLIGCHERAFEFFKGVPDTILYDNMKTVVRYSHEKGENKWNKKFLAFSKHQEFTPVRCRPYSPRTKGKVENGVKYVKQNFWPRLKSFSSISELNRLAFEWLCSTANKRVHGTTKEVPEERFKREKLNPFNPSPFLLDYLDQRKVMNDCMISYESNRYSVPYEHVGGYIGVKDLRNGVIELYDSSGKCVAKHEKLSGKHRNSYIKKHFENIVSGRDKKVAATAPKLNPKTTPEVQERPLNVYDQLLFQEAMNQC